VGDEAPTSSDLVAFLRRAGKDRDLQAAFWGPPPPYDAADPGRYDKFWDDERIQELLKKYGWDDLTDNQRSVIRMPRNLGALQSAIEHELRGEEWSCDDFVLHQHAHVSIGPCWVLVRV
jgi:hypothetical protein